MIKQYNTLSFVFFIPGFIIMALSVVLVMYLPRAISIPLLLLGCILCFVGSGYFAKSRGRSPAWGLLGIFSLPGLLVIYALEDLTLDRDEYDDEANLPDLDLSPPRSEPVESLDEAPSEPAGPLISGKLVVSVVVAISVILAASGWLYHYDQKRVPREFWGFESPRIMLESQTITAYLIKPEDVGAVAKPPYYDDLYMIDGLRYTVVKKVNITKREDLPALRQRLIDYRNFDSSSKVWKQPEWRFGLIFENLHEDSGAKYTSSIIFDSEGKLGRPQSVDKVISTAPMTAELLTFFENVFPESTKMAKATQLATHSFTQPLAAAPSATPSGTGIVPAVDSDRLTLPTGNPSGVSSPVSASPSGTEPSVLGRGPVVVPNVPLPPGLGGPPQVQQGFTLPGSTPYQSPAPPGGMPNIQLPGGLLPQSTTPPNSLDLSLPRGVTVPPIGGGAPQGSGT